MTCSAVTPLAFAIGAAGGGALLLNGRVRLILTGLAVIAWSVLAFGRLVDVGGTALRTYQACGVDTVVQYPILGAILGSVLVMIAKDIGRPHAS